MRDRLIKQLRYALFVVAVVGLSACGADQDPGPSDPGGDAPSSGPAASEVLNTTQDFQMDYLPAVEIVEREWDVELGYDVQDVSGVYAHYHDALAAEGFTRGGFEDEGDEVEADYTHADGRSIDLEVDLDDGRTQVHLDLDDATTTVDPDPFTARSFGGLEILFYDADVVEIEWDFEVDYAAGSTTVQEAYDFHHDALADMGWMHIEGETEWDEIEADYFVKDGVELELEVEEDDGRVVMEMELDEDRFYD